MRQTLRLIMEIKTINFLEENVGEYFHDLHIQKKILDRTQKTLIIKNNKLDFIKNKNICSLKDSIRKVILSIFFPFSTPIMCVCVCVHLTRDMYPSYIKNSYNLIRKTIQFQKRKRERKELKQTLYKNSVRT